ncbi:MAG: hypothetical protein PHW04_04690 [Candidatus Wallbacteria bacterium]|nr:hypothetical protein [Candidatus Wallbacteria bacterium]
MSKASPYLPNYLSKEIAVQTWMTRSFEFYFIGYALADTTDVHSDVGINLEPFFCSMGVEFLCKAFSIAEESESYIHENFEEAKKRIDKIAKKIEHKIKEAINEIGSDNPTSGISLLLKREYRPIRTCKDSTKDITGMDVLDCLAKAYIESRFPQPVLLYEKYPTGDFYYSSVGSSQDIVKFSYALGRELLFLIKEKHQIILDKKRVDCKLWNDDYRQNFWRIFFPDNTEKNYFIVEKPYVLRT